MKAETHQAMKILKIKSPIHLCIAPEAVRLLILALLIGAFPLSAAAQTVIGGVIPDPTAILDLQSSDRGLLLPRLTQAQRDAIQSPATGLMIFNTTSVCLEINFGTPSAPMWWPYTCRGSIGALDCASATANGNLTAGFPATASRSIPYTGGNGGPHPGQTVNSTGVTGLTATLPAGNFANGGGNLVYNITGTPAGAGTASFALDIGGQACMLSVTVVLPPGVISSLNCGGAVIAGTLTCSQASSGVIASIPYTGGNGGTYAMQSVSSTGVTGLTATLLAGVLGNGGGNLPYAITGTPVSYGTASFALSIGGQTCTLSLTVGQAAVGVISSLNCGAGITGFLTLYQVASVVRVIPYTGGNCGPHPGQTVTSTGITGLTATLPAGNFASGDGSLTYTITGTPASLGTASFALDIGGQTCTLLWRVGCSAYVAPGQLKEFMCHNLGAANVSADPFTPSWEVNGGYWQWGFAGMAAPGPSGPGAGQTNESPISGWYTINAPNGAWSDATKTANDPCPQGFRVPTFAQWNGVRNNNTQSITGTWTSSSTNYSSGRFFGPGLMLPAAGVRDGIGELYSRGYRGTYWSSSESGTGSSESLDFYSFGTIPFGTDRRNGHSLRCVAE